jgi:hypothetical protein
MTLNSIFMLAKSLKTIAMSSACTHDLFFFRRCIPRDIASRNGSLLSAAFLISLMDIDFSASECYRGNICDMNPFFTMMHNIKADLSPFRCHNNGFNHHCVLYASRQQQ